MSRGFVGLDVGTTAVRAAEVRGGEKRPQVIRFGQVLLPRGAVQDGEVQEPELVGQSIAALWKRAGFGSRNVRIGVSNRRVVVRQVELPAMARADLEGAIRFQAQDYIPIPLAEAVMDFEVVDEFAGPEGDALQRVLVVAAERMMVDPLIAAVQAAKLEPETLELNAYPLIRALGGEEAVASEAEAIIDVGGGVTNVVIHQGGKIRFTRILPSLGGDDFTEAISDALGLDWEDAESLKLRASEALAGGAIADTGDFEEPEPDDVAPDFGTETPEVELPEGEHEPDAAPESEEDAFEGGSTDEGADEATVARAVDVLGSVTQRFAGDVRASVDFYTTQAGALPLRAVVLTGGGSLLGGLAEAVGQALRVPHEEGRVFSRVPVGKVKMTQEQVAVAEPFLAVAVGLALGALES